MREFNRKYSEPSLFIYKKIHLEMATKRGIGSGIRKGGEVNLSLPKATRRKLEDEASVCARPRSRRIAAKAEQEPNHEDRIARMSWTVNDKEALLAALKAFGSRNIKELVRHTPDKNQQAILTFMNREKKNQVRIFHCSAERVLYLTFPFVELRYRAFEEGGF